MKWNRFGILWWNGIIIYVILFQLHSVYLNANLKINYIIFIRKVNNLVVTNKNITKLLINNFYRKILIMIVIVNFL